MNYNDILKKLDKKTHVYQVLAYLLQFNTITNMEAFRVIGDTRLSSTIHELRTRHGVQIDMTLERTSDGKSYGVYSLCD